MHDSFYTFAMTAKEFASNLLDESLFQLNACLDGVSQDQFVSQPIPPVMSMRDCLEHLTECCVAVQTDLSGGKHNWGTYSFPEGSMEALKAVFQTERAKAVEAALASFDDNAHHAKDFLIAHEFYHVGQMAIARHAIDPEWNVYSIYPSAS